MDTGLAACAGGAGAVAAAGVGRAGAFGAGAGGGTDANGFGVATGALGTAAATGSCPGGAGFGADHRGAFALTGAAAAGEETAFFAICGSAAGATALAAPTPSAWPLLRARDALAAKSALLISASITSRSSNGFKMTLRAPILRAVSTSSGVPLVVIARTSGLKLSFFMSTINSSPVKPGMW